MIIGIIGGGASGMAAAITAAENPQNEIILFERQARVGRKLQATGNGRCNLTNVHADQTEYHGEEPSFAEFAIREFPPAETIKWFADMGLYTVTEESGKVYPYSDQANSVLDILRFAMDKPNIQLKCGAEVERIKKTTDGFRIETSEETAFCHRLIIACGGLAGTKLGGTMAGYKLLRSMGHHCTRLRPALVQIQTDWPGIVSLKGVRANCNVRIICDGKSFAENSGEIQFTDHGVSGPVIFEISRDVCQQNGNWICQMDLLPHVASSELLAELKRRQKTELPASELLTGIVHNRLGRTIVSAAGISASAWIRNLNDYELQAVAELVKKFDIHLTEPLGMDSAQVTAGGILTSEFDCASLESKLVPGLFACGEVLDIDGDCGGFNLQWAWSSGRLAGLRAGGD